MGSPETDTSRPRPGLYRRGNGRAASTSPGGAGSRSITLSTTRSLPKRKKNDNVRRDNANDEQLIRRQMSAAPLSYDGNKAQTCIANCRQSFLKTLLAPTQLSNDDDDIDSQYLAQICTILSGAGAEDQLWQLYWCDSTFCGVWTEAGQVGQDPNVDLFINKCQNIGYASIYDPGPPPPGYSCNSFSAADPSGDPCPNLAVAYTVTPGLGSNAIAPTTTATADTSQLIIAPLPPPATAIGSTATVAATGTETQHATVSSSSSSNGTLPFATGPLVSPGNTGTATASAAASDRQSGELSAGAKVAVSVCACVGFLLLAGFALFLVLRRGRRQQHRRPLQGGPPYDHQRGGGDDLQMGGSGSSGSGSSGGGGGGLQTRFRPSALLWLRPSPPPPTPRGRWRPSTDGAVPTPLISPVPSCASAHGAAATTGASGTSIASGVSGNSASSTVASARRSNFFATLIQPTASVQATASAHPRPRTRYSGGDRRRHLLSTIFQRNSGNGSGRGGGRAGGNGHRSLSPPLTSLSPPPSPTALGANSKSDRPGDISNNAFFPVYGNSYAPYYFPSSPICAPTTNKLEPRRESTPTAGSDAGVSKKPTKTKWQPQQQLTRSPSLARLPIASAFLSRYDADSDSNNNNNSNGSSGPTLDVCGSALTTNMVAPLARPQLKTAPDVVAETVAPPLLSSGTTDPLVGGPARPPRPHEAALEIPDLVKPDDALRPRSSSAVVVGPSGRSFSVPTPATVATARNAGTFSGRTTAPPVFSSLSLSSSPTTPWAPAVRSSASSQAADDGSRKSNNNSSSSSNNNRNTTPTMPLSPLGPPPNRALPAPPPALSTATNNSQPASAPPHNNRLASVHAPPSSNGRGSDGGGSSGAPFVRSAPNRQG
ncbi:hypothetical protein SPI_08024 [Niveomyces insectorum RCEF 264]|uniref:Transmembrane protein n=1 Tax=Niveomyces insectorum RCEF 264 TaxID=1081102 RepID=A0A167NQV5_9HYPO|nr:hypothetical protein SPI_08024 [Niveomyces insectorum RCEF 264]